MDGQTDRCVDGQTDRQTGRRLAHHTPFKTSFLYLIALISYHTSTSHITSSSLIHYSRLSCFFLFFSVLLTALETGVENRKTIKRTTQVCRLRWRLRRKFLTVETVYPSYPLRYHTVELYCVYMIYSLLFLMLLLLSLLLLSRHNVNLIYTFLLP